MRENYFDKIAMGEYLSDRGRSSGSTLSWVDTEPERYEAWLGGEDSDRHTVAKGRGSYFHARVTEPDEVARDFAFYPNRNEATEEEFEERIGPRKGKQKVRTGNLVPQDASPAGRYKPMITRSAHAKRLERDFIESAKGRTIVYPETQPVVEAMVRAVYRHKRAAELLEVDGDFAPEMTGHFTCPETGERLRIRPDFIRPKARIWGELKSFEPPKGKRMDTLDASQVVRWAKQGWARKSGLIHTGCQEISGENWVGWWIVVEATQYNPRVSVIEDLDDGPDCLAALGRYGDDDGEHGEIKGYVKLARMAQKMRASGDFRHKSTQGHLPRFPLPDWLVNRMMFADARRTGAADRDDEPHNVVPPVLGATPLEDYDGP